MSMKQRKMRQLKKAARREMIYQIVNSIPGLPRGLKRILRGFLSTLAFNLLFATALACIVFWFVSGV